MNLSFLSHDLLLLSPSGVFHLSELNLCLPTDLSASQLIALACVVLGFEVSRPNCPDFDLSSLILNIDFSSERKSYQTLLFVSILPLLKLIYFLILFLCFIKPYVSL